MSERAAWELDAIREREVVRDVMATLAGRKLLLRLITPALLAGSYVPGDQAATAFNEGRRSMALELLALLDRTAPDLLLVSRREELDEMETKLIERAKSAKEGESNG